MNVTAPFEPKAPGKTLQEAIESHLACATRLLSGMPRGVTMRVPGLDALLMVAAETDSRGQTANADLCLMLLPIEGMAIDFNRISQASIYPYLGERPLQDFEASLRAALLHPQFVSYDRLACAESVRSFELRALCACGVVAPEHAGARAAAMLP